MTQISQMEEFVSGYLAIGAFAPLRGFRYCLYSANCEHIAHAGMRQFREPAAILQVICP